MKTEVKKNNLPTYVFIDASNIMRACQESCRFSLDFDKLMRYLQGKHKNLRSVIYYEGIAREDDEKRAKFRELELLGYQIHSLERKTYIDPPVLKDIPCPHCDRVIQDIEVLPESCKMKSNVDVYIATDMMEIANEIKGPAQFILLSCDGDYKECIQSLLRCHPKLRFTVLATPYIPFLRQERFHIKNYLSIRLREPLTEYPNRYHLNNINDIRKIIEKSSDEKNGLENK